MREPDKEEIFVQISEHLDLRTSILESAKLSTQLLKNYQNISQIHKQRKRERLKLNLLMSEMKSLVKTLEFKDINFGNETEERTISKQYKKEDKSRALIKDKLTLDLEEIERKLNNLKI